MPTFTPRTTKEGMSSPSQFNVLSNKVDELSNASATYETKANASATYETKANASSTYVSKTEAVGYDDILTNANASTTYPTKTEMTNAINSAIGTAINNEY